MLSCSLRWKPSGGYGPEPPVAQDCVADAVAGSNQSAGAGGQDGTCRPHLPVDGIGIDSSRSQLQPGQLVAPDVCG